MSRPRRLLVALAFVAIAISFFLPLVRAQETRLRVMTWNVRFDFEDDGENRWARRKEAVAKTISASGASIVTIQEDKEDQIEDLQGLLPDYGFAGRGRNANGSGERCSVLYHKRHLALVDSGSLWLSDTPDEPGSRMEGDEYPRVVTWALLRTGSGKRILALSAHFPEGDDEARRAKAAGILADWLARRLEIKRAGQPPSLVVVLAGDFNSDAGVESHGVLVERLTLRDAWDEAKPRGMPGTYNGFEGLRTKKRIDWILAGGPVRVVEAGKIEEKVDGRWPSDHYPVWADIEVR
ncbi:MAG: endonuclease/exonuclease/phosphatase family protein [Planctomycetes bacterium]|nr:endonuclease/exonuclease/phosphatase family protein [Planctomycetota bacterium]